LIKFLTDTFTGTAASLLTAHTPETGGGWSLHPAYTGNLQLVGNGRVRSVDNNYGLVLSNALPEERNQVFTATLRCQTNVNYALMAMRASPTAQTYYEIGYFAGVGWKVTRWLAGNPVQIGSTVTAVLTAATDYTILIECRDHYAVPGWCRITITVNGAVVTDGVNSGDWADTTPLTGTRMGLITFGPASDSTGLQWSNVNAWDTFRFDFRTQGDGQPMLVIPPKGWSDSGTDHPPAIQYFHGAGEDYSAPAAYGGDKEEFVYDLWAAGYLIFSSNADGGQPGTAQNWGNPISVVQQAAAYQYALDHYRITAGQVLGWGQSMGGLDLFQSMFDSRYTYVGFLAIKAACNLDAMHAGVFNSNINTAYAANDGNFAVKSYLSNPVLIAATSFPRTSIYAVAASDDTLVVTADNLDVMQTLTASRMVEFTLELVVGDHSSAQFYDETRIANLTDAIVRFFARSAQPSSITIPARGGAVRLANRGAA